jgi:hypothetical protein
MLVVEIVVVEIVFFELILVVELVILLPLVPAVVVGFGAGAGGAGVGLSTTRRQDAVEVDLALLVQAVFALHADDEQEEAGRPEQQRRLADLAAHLPAAALPIVRHLACSPVCRPRC